MNAPDTLTRIERIRLRDGDRCWLCNGKLDFEAAPNSSKSPTVEHLTAKANGGTNALENLVLTHPGCNKQLGARAVEDKLRMRAKYRVSRERAKAAREVCASTPVEEGGCKRVHRQSPADVLSQMQAFRLALRRWQAWTAVAAGTALLAVGFAAGMLVVR